MFLSTTKMTVSSLRSLHLLQTSTWAWFTLPSSWRYTRPSLRNSISSLTCTFQKQLENRELDEENPDLLTSYSTTILDNDELLCNASEVSKSTNFTPETVFIVTAFFNPTNFGVRQFFHTPKNQEDPFVTLSKSLEIVFRRSRNMDITDVKFGCKVLLDRRQFSSVTGFWDQKIWRGIVVAEANHKILNEKSPLEVSVCVELIDHGLTSNEWIDELRVYEHEEGTEDLFSTPPFGYRVMLSTLRPMHRIDYDWSEQEGMRRLLKDPGNYNRLVRLQIEKSSIVDRIIVASDMFGRDSGKSFVEDCVAMRFGVRLSTNLTMLQDPMTASPVFCPRPRNRPVFEIYQSRSEKFRCLYNSNKSNDDGSRIMQFTFTEIFSPLEVHFVPLLDDLKGVTLMMSTDSVNCRPLDYQLASLNSRDSYEPLFAVASEFDQIYIKNAPVMRASNSTILPPIPNIVPIISSLTYPLVEIIAKNGKPNTMRFYAQSLSPTFELKSEFKLIHMIKKQDVADIEEIRHVINQRHMMIQPVDRSDTLRDKLKSLLISKRSEITERLDISNIDPLEFTPREKEFLVAQIKMTIDE